MASMRRRLDSLYDRLEDNRLLLAVRNGILMTIPAVMAGSIALLLISIPLDGYQNALQALWGGALYQIFSVAHGATLGSISLLMLLAISYSYADTTRMSGKEIVPLVSLCAYIAFTMGEDLSIHPTIFQSTWLFYAILVALSSSALFVGLLNRLPFHLKTYADGENALFRPGIRHYSARGDGDRPGRCSQSSADHPFQGVWICKPCCPISTPPCSAASASTLEAGCCLFF